MQFINREQEKKDLIAHLETEPNAILFLYGPKSCGKTSLINNVINNKLDKKKFDIKYINFRNILMTEYQDFINVFFRDVFVEKNEREIEEIRKYNLGIFSLDVSDKQKILEKKLNPFEVMTKKLRNIADSNLRPIIIIDEIQTIKDMLISENKSLISELFNYFVSLTKEMHLAHVVILTSDSYFIEDIYSNAKLSKTSNFYLVNHLEKAEIIKWLSQKEYNFSQEDIDYIWEKFGGSAWEIWELIKYLKSDLSLKEAVQKNIEELQGKLWDFYDNKLDRDLRSDFKKVSCELADKGVYKIRDEDNLSSLIREAVEKDFWFYNASKRSIIPNSKSIQNVFKEIFK